MLSVYYEDGKGEGNMITCDCCSQMIGKKDWEEAYALHRIPKELPKKLFSPITLVHRGWARAWIEEQDAPGDRWFFAGSEELKGESIGWTEVDREAL